jgi:ADP-ribosyl-[dinitrogen reductase] hydrolase
MMTSDSRLLGCLLGCAVGDSVGLPREGLSRRRAVRLFGETPLRQCLLPGRGGVSDDTEHACLTLIAYSKSDGDVDRFARALAGRLRWWIASIPPGVGFATLRSCLKLWLGWSPARSGMNSAGNGPCMRAPVLGVLLADPRQRKAYVDASSLITHRDARALEGARLIADCAAGDVSAGTLTEVADRLEGDELRERIRTAAEFLKRGASPEEFAAAIGCERGVPGYVNTTVPVAVYCWLRYPTDLRAAVEGAISLGGDADTVAAITGALAGATLGPDAIPEEWLRGLMGPVFNWDGITRIAAGGGAPWAARLVRNVSLTAVVLGHVARRVLPPY